LDCLDLVHNRHTLPEKNHIKENQYQRLTAAGNKEAAVSAVKHMTTHGYKRADRVGDSILREIASMLQRGEIKDPRIGFVTITHVKLSDDLKEAKVYFTQLGTKEEINNSIEGLQSAVGYIRRTLGHRLNLKAIPRLTFFFDETLEYAEHIDELLLNIKKGEGAG